MARELNVAADREPPHIEHPRPFGCTAYVHKKGPNRPARSAEMEARAMKGLLVGYGSLRGHIYHVYVPDKKKVFRCRDARFCERPQKTVLPPVAKTPVTDDSDFNVHFDDPDLLILRPVASTVTDASEERVASIGEQTSNDKSTDPEPAHIDHMMSPPPEEVLHHQISAEDTTAVTNNATQTSTEAYPQDEDDDESSENALEAEEADHTDPAHATEDIEEATDMTVLEEAVQTRPRRAAQKPERHYRQPAGVREYKRKLFAATEMQAPDRNRHFALSAVTAAAPLKVLPDGIVIPTSYDDAISTPR